MHLHIRKRRQDWIPSTQVDAKVSGSVCNLDTEEKRRGPQGLPNQLPESASSRFTKDPALKRRVKSNEGKHLTLTFDLHILVRISAHAPKYKHTHHHP